MQKRKIISLMVCWGILHILPAVPASARTQEPPQKMIAFTFDDGPHPKETERLLDGLAERNAKATFFVIASKIDAATTDVRTQTNIELVRRMAEEGHEVGNHTYSHCYLTQVSKEKVSYELTKASAVLESVTGVKPRYMRPPGGGSLTAPWVREIASPMITVCWSGVDTRDWECRNVPRMVEKIVKSAKDGAIVLLHDNYATSVDAALQAMDILAKQGYSFVTVDTLLSRNLGDEYELNPMRIYSAMYPGDVSKLQRKA